jgi:hypothetical protein
MIRGTELPGIAQEYGDNFSRLQPRCDQSSGQRFDRLYILPITKPSPAGSVDQRGFIGMFPARCEDGIM